MNDNLAGYVKRLGMEPEFIGGGEVWAIYWGGAWAGRWVWIDAADESGEVPKDMGQDVRAVTYGPGGDVLWTREGTLDDVLWYLEMINTFGDPTDGEG